MKKLFVLIFALLFPSLAMGTPAPTGATWSGNLASDTVITISGNGFGSNSLDIEWLGGASGVIESGTNGTDFSRSGWSVDSTSSERNTPEYSTTRYHSGSKSIKQSWPIATQYTSGMGYDTGGSIGTLYATWWIFFDRADSGGQYKMFRIMGSDSYMDADGTFYMYEHYDSGGLIYLFCDYESYDQCYPGSSGSLRYPAEHLSSDSWVRVEVYGKESSSAGARDGELSILYHTQSSTVSQVLSSGPWIGNIITRATGVSTRWRWLEFEGYWGNITGGSGTNEVAYLDDIYIQVGTQARVELCAESTWSSRRHCEIQPPSSWGSTSLSITANRGSFGASDSAYIYVIDSTGSVNSIGYGPITFGSTSGGGDTTPPTITSVSSDKTNGQYKAGEVIDIDVTFSEAVTSTGNVTVTLETGTTDRTCTFTVLNSTTGTCDYTVQAGDTSSDLNVNSISGTIKDLAGNSMVNFTPTTNLATNKALVIDTTAPSVNISTTDPSSITSDSLTVTGTVSDTNTITSCRYLIGSAPTSSTGTACGSTAWSCATSGYARGTNNLYVGCFDTAGNVGTDYMTVYFISINPVTGLKIK